MKSQAIMIATPFSFALDLMASLFAVNLAIRENRWTLVALEFALVAVLLRIFYSIPSIGPECVMLYSTLLGFEPAAQGVIQSDDEGFQSMRNKEKKVSGVVIDSPVDCGISFGWFKWSTQNSG
ncbi:hypothetical protein Droror1_Dr00002246 [Drosera rotundifolia]